MNNNACYMINEWYLWLSNKFIYYRNQLYRTGYHNSQLPNEDVYLDALTSVKLHCCKILVGCWTLLSANNCKCNFQLSWSFSALMLLVGQQKEHPACTNWVLGCWRGCLFGAGCKFCIWPSWCHCHLLSRAPVNPDCCYPSGTGLTG